MSFGPLNFFEAVIIGQFIVHMEQIIQLSIDSSGGGHKVCHYVCWEAKYAVAIATPLPDSSYAES